MAKVEYELAAAYIRLLPSFDGLAEELSKELNKSFKDQKEVLSKIYNKTANSFGKSLSSVLSTTSSFAAPLVNTFIRVASKVGTVLTDTITDSFRFAASAGATILTGAVAAIGGQIIAGGFTRALGLNEAQARLKAMGFSLQELAGITKSAANAVEGTAFTLAESFGAAGPLIQAGIKPGKELENVLKNVGKLSSISGRSFKDMGVEFVKNSAAGVVQWQDLLRIINSGVNILNPLSKTLGVSVNEVKKLGSASKISFADFNRAVESIEFDTVVFAASSVTQSFRNVRSQLSKIGAKLWDPIMVGTVPLLNSVREFLIDFQAQTTDQFSNIANNIKDWFEDVNKFINSFRDEMGKFNTKPLVDKLLNIVNTFHRVRKELGGLQAPLAGILAGLAGTFLRQLPLIGGMFSGLTIPVGLFIGLMAGAWYQSDKLKSSFKGLTSSIGSFFKTIYKSVTKNKNGDLVKGFGDNLAKGLDFITSQIGNLTGLLDGFDLSGAFNGIVKSLGDGIKAFIKSVMERGPEISEALGKVWQTVTDVFSGGSSINAANLGDTLVNVFLLIADALRIAIPVIADLAGIVAKILTSDAITGLVGWLSNVADFVASHKKVVKGLAATLAVWFVAKKLSGPLMAAISFMGVFGGKGGKHKAVTKMGSFGLVPFIEGLAAASTALLYASPFIIAGIGALAAILAALAAVGYAARESNAAGELRALGDTLFEVIRFIVDSIGYAIKTLYDIFTDVGLKIAEAVVAWWPQLEPILTFFSDNFVIGLQAVTDSLVSLATAFSTSGVIIIDALSGFTTGLFSGLTSLITVLADKGPEAAVGALAAAAGLAAIVAVMTGDRLLGALTSLLPGGGSSPIEFIDGLLLKLIDANQIIVNMPNAWAEITNVAYSFGVEMISAIVAGMEDQANALDGVIYEVIENMLNQAQMQLDANPLDIRFSKPNLALAGGRAGGQNSTTKNSNYYLTSSNDDVIRKVARGAR